MKINLLPVIPFIVATIIGCQPNTSAQPVKSRIERKIPEVNNTQYPPDFGNYNCQRKRVEAGDVDDKLSFTLMKDNRYESENQYGSYTPTTHEDKTPDIPGFEMLAPPDITWSRGYLEKWNGSYHGKTGDANTSIIVLAQYPSDPNTVYFCLHSKK